MATGKIIHLHTLKRNTYCLQHRCRSMQILGSAKDFVRISPNLPEVFGQLFVRIFSPTQFMKTYFGMTSETKGLHVTLQALGAIF